MASISFTDRELDVMAVLWVRGSGTVAEVREALSDEFARTTVLTVLRILEEKGYVRHKMEGQAHRYFATVDSKAAGRTALARILDTMFGGSHELMFAEFVSDRAIDREKLKQLRSILEARFDADTKRGTRK